MSLATCGACKQYRQIALRVRPEPEQVKMLWEHPSLKCTQHDWTSSNGVCHPIVYDSFNDWFDVLGLKSITCRNLSAVVIFTGWSWAQVDLEDPHNIAQIIQGAGFIALAMWLIFANNSKVTGASSVFHRKARLVGPPKSQNKWWISLSQKHVFYPVILSPWHYFLTTWFSVHGPWPFKLKKPWRKVAVAQKAPLEQRHAVCATISTAVALLGEESFQESNNNNDSNSNSNNNNNNNNK